VGPFEIMSPSKCVRGREDGWIDGCAQQQLGWRSFMRNDFIKNKFEWEGKFSISSGSDSETKKNFSVRLRVELELPHQSCVRLRGYDLQTKFVFFLLSVLFSSVC
jgi:hypothetical protein